MDWLAPLALGLSLWAPPADGVSLTAQAASSARPRECAPRDPRRRGKKLSVWAKARTPELVAYCDLVARAHVQLEADPKAALELADQADKVWPDHAGALVARGRALVATGKAKEALAPLTRARELDAGALDDPRALRAYGRALVASGDLAGAAEAYRTLAPRTTLVPEPLRVAILVEAALATTAAIGAEPAPAKPEAAGNASLATRLAEPEALLAEARAAKSGVLACEIALAQALVFDRAGEPVKSAAALAEAARLGPAGDVAALVAAPADALALAALAAEVDRAAAPDAATKAWGAYVAAETIGPWLERGKARLAALSGKPAKKKSK